MTEDTARSQGGGERSGGRTLVDQLVIQGARQVFCVPGESFLPVLDALRDSTADIGLTVCRHEAGAANMADAYGKLTGEPGVCLVTRGPGAMHAAIGVHTAAQDSTPMVLLIGQVAREHLGREAFQEMDYRQVFGSVAKWVVEVDDPDRLPEFVARAFHVATSGRPGPVVVSLPEDVLRATTNAADVPRATPSRAHPGADDLRALHEVLAAAQRPLVVVGGGAWDAATSANVLRFAERQDLPVAAAFRRQDHVDNHHDHYVGDLGLAINPKLEARLRDADLLIVVGARLDDPTTGSYTRVVAPRPSQTVVHVHPDPHELGRVFAADVQINAGVAEFAAALDDVPSVDSSRWADWRAEARADYLAFLTPPDAPVDGVDLGAVMATLRDVLPADTIIANGAGNYTVWVHRFLQFSQVRSQLAPTSGAMGYGVPAAVAAKITCPERTVVGFAGDGCFLMTGQELATAVKYDLDVVFIVVNNAQYGTIRMHQERGYPGRAFGVDLVNPDFAAYARSFGAFGERVQATEDFAAAFERASTAGGPALLELVTDPKQLSPAFRID